MKRPVQSLPEFIDEQLKKAGDSLLLCRVGDFYELFDEQAVIASRCLGLALTSRGERHMVGFPYHFLSAYQAKLESCGYSVVVVVYKPCG